MKVDDATVCPSISVTVHVRACIGACVCMHFYSACRARGSCFRLQLVRPRSRSRILAREELGLQVAYGAGLPFFLEMVYHELIDIGGKEHVLSLPHTTV